ncbi:MAG: sugar ABC transporter permease [Ruminiclostridium sp.]|nr:sugar ABC transporter permease [Ruminiclostridium sp.]
MNKKHKSVSYAKWGLIFIAPFFIVYIVCSLFPLLSTFVYSFMDYRVQNGEILGPAIAQTTVDGVATTDIFKNYTWLFSPDSAGRVIILNCLWNTIVMWLMGAIPQLVFSLLLAVIFTSERLRIKGQPFFKSVIYLPNIIMAAAFAMLFFTLFAPTGPINQIFYSQEELLNGGGIRFFDNTWSARGLVATINFLMWFGNTTILLMAGIMGIDQSLFEAAAIDGATSFQVFRKITIPLLAPIMVYVAITSLIGGLQMFDVPQILTNGEPNITTKTLVMFLNDYLGNNKNYGRAGAISVITFIITAIFSFIVFKTMSGNPSKPKKKKAAKGVS